MYRSAVAALVALSACSPATAQSSDAALTLSLRRALAQYIATRAKPEHISAASLSISLKGSEKNINLAAGTTKYPNVGAKVTPADLFEIGSITKSFTSVAILRLETADKLTIEDKLGKWLPQYPAWKDVTIYRLLDMTSPIPGYDNQPSIAKIMGDDPSHRFSPEELVASAYPHNGKPEPVSGWTYSNTNYILAQMIVEKASGKPYADVVRELFDQVGLKNSLLRTKSVSGVHHGSHGLRLLLQPRSHQRAARAAARERRQERQCLLDAGRRRHRLVDGRCLALGARAL